MFSQRNLSFLQLSLNHLFGTTVKVVASIIRMHKSVPRDGRFNLLLPQLVNLAHNLINSSELQNF